LNNNFEACTEQCAAAGTSCAGAAFGSFGGSQQQCYLYSKMVAAEAPAYPIVAAIRTSSSDGAIGNRQVLQNGGFDGTLTPWTSGQTASGSGFTVVDNTATIRMSLAARAASTGANAEDSIVLQQQIRNPVDADNGYFLSMDVTIQPVLTGPTKKRQASNSQVTCTILVRSGAGDTFVSQVLGDATGPRTIYGSGTTQAAGIQIMLINVVCRGTRDVVVRFDNIKFSVFEPDNSGSSCDTSLLKNGNFDSQLAPWTFSQGASTSASVAVTGGQAVVRFGANTGINDAPARLTQSITMPAGQAYRITAQLVFTIASSSCQVDFRDEHGRLTNTDQIDRSQTIPFVYNDVSDIQATNFTISVSCGSPNGGVNSVGVDSVALILNPDEECPTTG
jgi:hypothetical protein